MTDTPACGTTASFAMLIDIHIDLAARRAYVAALARPFVAALNSAVGAVDRPGATLRAQRPGSVSANFHVVSETWQ